MRTLHGTARSHFEDPEGHAIPASKTYLDDRLPNDYFRQDLIALIHEMRMPGWSHVTGEMAPDLDIVRISGALTNSVYAVKPPRYVVAALKKDKTHRRPVNLLLRIYGLQVGFLIDRGKELATIAKLSQLNIGPRLLGTFSNGRFEQFLNAKPLTKEDMRRPDVVVQIARRMRELHDRVPLAPAERAEGARCFRNLDKWVPLAEKHLALFEQKAPGITDAVMNFDGHGTIIENYLCERSPPSAPGARRSLLEFLVAVREYRAMLESKYAGEELVFCHNDTQYGNILRLEPPKGSPLLQPQNEYRQLVVIDFEYSGPNVRGYDIANHFCEWMSDYHHADQPHHIWLDRYPVEAEIDMFLVAYVEHGMTVFDEAEIERSVRELKAEIRDFLPIVNACWAVWGIVQMPTDAEDLLRIENMKNNPQYEVKANLPNLDVEETDEFDYLSYAGEKVALFWRDVIANTEHV